MPKSATKGLTDKQLRFVQEYRLCLDATAAARKVGYKSPENIGRRMLKNPKIKALLKIKAKALENRVELKIETIVSRLYDCITREATDFMDEKTGEIITDVRQLSPRGRRVIDGIKQKKKCYTDGEGNEHVEIETELKLVPLATAMDMGLKHLGGYAPEKSEVKVSIDWDEVMRRGNRPDVLEAKILYKPEFPELVGMKSKPLVEYTSMDSKPVDYSVDELIDAGDEP